MSQRYLAALCKIFYQKDLFTREVIIITNQGYEKFHSEVLIIYKAIAYD